MRRWITVPVVLVMLAVGGYLILTTRPTPHRPPNGPVPTRTFTTASPLISSVPVVHVSEKAPLAGTMTAQACDPTLEPNTLIIPALCIDGDLVHTDLRQGSLQIPHDVHQIGEWGASLAASTGTTLLAGHVNYVGQGDGALYQLADVKPGMLVYATRANGQVTVWRIAGLAVTMKPHVPLWVFSGDQGPRRLAIITCGGPLGYVQGWGWNYKDNIIATAVAQ
ncbi:class F sortase [Ferrimicrobium acidiphilum]|uniref:class F sortase n=1 Tax=Ferrimicrobium acidiphilum TaxID=121039 RepID=UPI0023F526AD|nr:class F sortase [Ferrimicrobium acidiphilum]